MLLAVGCAERILQYIVCVCVFECFLMILRYIVAFDLRIGIEMYQVLRIIILYTAVKHNVISCYFEDIVLL